MRGPHMSSSPTRPTVLCVNTGGAGSFHLRSKLREWAAAAPAELIEYANTAEARSWVGAAMNRDEPRTGTKNPVPRPPSLVVVGYQPDESWSLTVLLSQLLDHGMDDCPEVVLVAEGPRWVLPVLVTDFPRLTVVPPGEEGREALVGILDKVITADLCLVP